MRESTGEWRAREAKYRYLAAAGGRGTAVLDERAARTAHKTSPNLETAVRLGRRRRVAAGDERKEGPPKLTARPGDGQNFAKYKSTFRLTAPGSSRAGVVPRK